MNKREKQLSLRLEKKASSVKSENRFCDVGTDHAYLPIYLVKNNICPNGIASDINKGPLKKAEENIKKEGLSEKIITILTSGLEKISPDSFDSLIIAGMGGEMIISIIEPYINELKGKQVILQPMNCIDKLRSFLSDNNIEINEEKIVFEDKKMYIIMETFFEKGEKLSLNEVLFSKYILEHNIPFKKEYLDFMIKKYSVIYNGQKKSKNEDFKKTADYIDFLIEMRNKI